jgi:iron complex outermembrane receptor protein
VVGNTEIKRPAKTGTCHREILLGLVGLLAFAASAGAAEATADATGDSAVLEEVVVTATKRATNEQTTPASLTAFTAADLSVEHVNNLTDLAMFTPGLFVGSDNGFGATAMAIRGFGPLNLSIGGDEAVGVYIDGVYQGTPYGNQFTFIDVDQIEVLRGPQGTLWGRNATGGAILINSVAPGQDTIVRADIGVGQLNSYEGRALVSGPITDNGLSGKIAIGKTSRDGWATNPVLGVKLNGENDLSTSAGLRWYQGGVWDVALNVHYGTQNTTLAAKNAADGLPIDQIPADFPNASDRKFGGATLNATATLPWAKFTSTTGYTNADAHSLTSSANVGLTQFLEVSKASEWYEELRLASNGNGAFSWIVGTTGLRQHSEDVVDYLLTAEDLGGPNNLGIVFDNALITTSYAGFVELGWQVTDRLRLTAGDRYTRDKKDWENCETFGQYSNLQTGSFSPVVCNTPFNGESRTWSASTPKGVIDYKFTDFVYGYASVNKGFRSGGWNFTSAVNPATPYSTAFNPEYATSYETGLKSEFFDRRVRANVSAYLADYTDLQVRTIDPVFHLLGVHNAGSARTKGVELQVLAKPASPLTLGANVAWERALYKSFSYESAGTAVNYAGHYLNDAPEWMFGLNASYKILLSGRGALTPRIDASYQSHVYYTEANVAPYDGPAHEAVNLHLRYDAASSPWGWDVYVNNVTNNQWREYAYQGQGTVVGANYALPRTIGLRLFWNE